MLVRVVLNLLANPFAIAEVLASRGWACPDKSLMHSALNNCGQALYSLEDFYDSVEEASAVFWGIFSFLVNLIVSSVPAKDANIISPLFYGGVKYAGSTQTVSLAPVIYKAQVFNMAGLGTMLGGRRLLQGGGGAGLGNHVRLLHE